MGRPSCRGIEAYSQTALFQQAEICGAAPPSLYMLLWHIVPLCEAKMSGRAGRWALQGAVRYIIPLCEFRVGIRGLFKYEALQEG